MNDTFVAITDLILASVSQSTVRTFQNTLKAPLSKTIEKCLRNNQINAGNV